MSASCSVTSTQHTAQQESVVTTSANQRAPLPLEPWIDLSKKLDCDQTVIQRYGNLFPERIFSPQIVKESSRLTASYFHSEVEAVASGM